MNIILYKAPTKEDIGFCSQATRLSHKNKKIYSFYDDLKLLSKLVLNGDDHAKSIRGLQVYFILEAPRYFWQEFVTYKIGNEQLGSESTIHNAPKFNNETDFIEYKQNIKEGTLQTRYFVTNYQTLRRMYFARRHHRLPEWKEFCSWIETLPYSKELIIKEKLNVK